MNQTLSRGGFSIVYLATDLVSGAKVILKEYMPSKLARRDRSLAVVARSDQAIESFKHGRKRFLQEASALAGLKHPNIVNVTDFFSTNGTVYMAMQHEHGENLQAYIRKHRGGLSERFILTVFPALLDGLRMIHESRQLHLDVKPSNIHLRPGGSPLLLDFGAVHQILQSRAGTPAQVVTPGYAPVEQYNNRGYVGPWTDIYALGATMRCCIEGRAPPLATERHEKETMRPAASAFKKRYSEQLLSAIDWSMEIDPLCRPQSVDALVQALPDLAEGSRDTPRVAAAGCSDPGAALK